MSKYYLDYTGFSGLSRGAKIGIGLGSLATLGAGAYGAHKLYKKMNSPEDIELKKAYKEYKRSVKADGGKVSKDESFENFKKGVEDLKYTPNRSDSAVWVNPAEIYRTEPHTAFRFDHIPVREPYKRVLAASRFNDEVPEHNKKAAEFNKWRDRFMRITRIDHSGIYK